MDEIKLTDEEAHSLIQILKVIIKRYKVDLSPGNKGSITLKSDCDNYEFCLHYFTPEYRDDKMSLHLRELENNYNLVRINIDTKTFHRNADGTMVKGHRLLLFSNKERLEKIKLGDFKTHVKAFELPTEFKDVSDLEMVFIDFLNYIKVKQQGLIEFPPLF